MAEPPQDWRPSVSSPVADMETTFSSSAGASRRDNMNTLRNWRRMALTTIDSVYLKLCLYLLHLERASQGSEEARDYAKRQMRALSGFTDLLLETE